MNWTVILEKLAAMAPTLLPAFRQFGKDFFPDVEDGKKQEAAATVMFSDPEMIKKLQAALNKHMASELKVDGLYGVRTRDAVKKAQEKLGVKVDGWAGPATHQAMTKAKWL